MNIAAASILAKEYHEDYITNLVETNQILNNCRLRQDLKIN